MVHHLRCQDLSVEVDGKGTLRFHVGARTAVLPVPLRVQILGTQAALHEPVAGDGGLRFALAAGERGGDGAFSAGGVLRLTSRGDALRIVVSLDGAQRTDKVRIEIPFPAGTVLHVPTGRTYGERIDGTTPPGREKGLACVYRPHQFVAAETPSTVMSIIAHADPARLPHDTWGPRWKIGAFAEEGIAWAAFETHPGEALEIALDESLDRAIERHHDHLRRDYGARPWRESAPSWLGGVRLIVTLDMMRSNGEIAHDFGHVAALCRELKRSGLRGGALFYLPGFQGRYDSSFPVFWPAEALGGDRGFREMVDTAHECGHWIMPHCMTWGADPCHPVFEEIEDCAAIPDPEENLPGFEPLGPYKGWPSCMPPTPLGIDTGFIPIRGERDGDALVFATTEIPQPMEAMVSLAGIGGTQTGRVRARLHGREVYSMPGDLSNGACTLRFRLRFEKGINRITLAFSAGVTNLESAVYRIHDAIWPGPNGIWTHPIVRMDQSNPRWIGVVRDRIARLVTAFGVDAIHLDAGNVRWQGEAPMHRALAEALPGTMFGCEYLSELGHFFFHLTQGGALPPDGSHPLTDLGWRLSDPFLRFYYHLCKTEAFVPAASVCNQEPVRPALQPEKLALAERQWAEAARWHLVPNIRLNYRDYRLDPRTRAAFGEALGGGG